MCRQSGVVGTCAASAVALLLEQQQPCGQPPSACDHGEAAAQAEAVIPDPSREQGLVCMHIRDLNGTSA